MMRHAGAGTRLASRDRPASEVFEDLIEEMDRRYQLTRQTGADNLRDDAVYFHGSLRSVARHLLCHRMGSAVLKEISGLAPALAMRAAASRAGACRGTLRGRIAT